MDKTNDLRTRIVLAPRRGALEVESVIRGDGAVQHRGDENRRSGDEQDHYGRRRADDQSKPRLGNKEKS
jgi:hypothetical protein